MRVRPSAQLAGAPALAPSAAVRIKADPSPPPGE